MYEQEKIKNSVAFPAVFRMGLRLLAEQAAEECDFEGNKLAAYVTKYAKEAKGKLRQLDRGKDITTFLATQSVKPENFIMLLQMVPMRILRLTMVNRQGLSVYCLGPC